MSLLEKEFDKNVELTVDLKCSKGHQFSETICYGGVVSSNKREMSTEYMHVWNNEDIRCPKCGEEITVELEVWEYPVGMLNFASFQNSDCEVLNKKELSKIIGIDIE